MMGYKLMGYCTKKLEESYYIFPKKRIDNELQVLEVNEIGKEILDMLKKGLEIDEIVSYILLEYEVDDKDMIKYDILSFFSVLKKFGILQVKGKQIDEYDNRIDDTISIADGLKKYQLLQKFYAEKQLPYKFFVELTYNCNLRCRHCYKTEDVIEAKSSPVYLEKEVVFSVLDEIENLDVIEVYLTGGEVFLHPDIIEIIEYASNKNFRLIILSNGNVLEKDDIINKIKELEIYDIRISIYGNSKSHDEMTRVKGSFEKSINALKKIKQAMGIGTAVYVVTKENYKDCTELVKFFKDEKINYSLNTHLTPTSYGELFPLDFRVTKEQYECLHKDYEMPLVGTSCSAGLSRFRITPFGDVNPCELIRNVTFGNVHGKSIQKIIESDERKQFIKEFSSMAEQHNCNACKMQNYCNFCPAMFFLENGSYNIPSKYLCELTAIKSKIAMEKMNV